MGTGNKGEADAKGQAEEEQLRMKSGRKKRPKRPFFLEKKEIKKAESRVGDTGCSAHTS